jgi:hypothetical protein
MARRREASAEADPAQQDQQDQQEQEPDPAVEQESQQPNVEEAEPARSTEEEAGGGDEEQSRPETGFRDVSEAVEAAQEEASRPLELDDDGNPVPRNMEPAAVVSEEMSYRSSAQANGGGPWPPEVLAQQFTQPRRLERSIPAYTSHEDQ